MDLKFITLKYFKTYIQDPSNKDEKFLRVKIRKFKKKMETEGLNTSNIMKTINNLLSGNKAMNYYKNKAFNKHVSFLSKNKCVINEQIFIDEEPQTRVMLPLSLSYDHRIIDGAEAAKFCNEIKENLGKNFAYKLAV